MDGVDIPPNIRAAISRSRAARRAIRRRRRRTAAALACLCLATAVPLTLSFADFTAGDVLQAAVAEAQSLADLLDKRSPGERVEAQLTKHKRQHALARHRAGPKVTATPNEVALATLLTAPPEPLPVDLTAAALPLMPAPPSLGSILNAPGGGGGAILIPPGSGSSGTPPGGGSGGTPPGGGSLIPPGGGDTPLSNPKDSREPIVIETPGAVPEPATWAMMLLGFGLIGWRIRYVPRAKLDAA